MRPPHRPFSELLRWKKQPSKPDAPILSSSTLLLARHNELSPWCLVNGVKPRCGTVEGDRLSMVVLCSSPGTWRDPTIAMQSTSSAVPSADRRILLLGREALYRVAALSRRRSVGMSNHWMPCWSNIPANVFLLIQCDRVPALHVPIASTPKKPGNSITGSQCSNQSESIEGHVGRLSSLHF